MLKYATRTSPSSACVCAHHVAVSFTVPLMPPREASGKTYGRGVNVTTDETDIDPSCPRATATASILVRLAKSSGSTKARYGAESSTATFCHAPPFRRIANHTDTGWPGTVAGGAVYSVRASGAAFRCGFRGEALGMEPAGTAPTADTAGIVSVSPPFAVPVPKTTRQVVPGVAVGTVTV